MRLAPRASIGLSGDVPSSFTNPLAAGFLSRYKAFVFDFDGTLYDYKHLKINVIKNRPMDFFNVKAEGDVRRELKGKWFGSAQAFRSEQLRLLRSKRGFPSDESALAWYDDFVSGMIDVLTAKYTARPFARPLLRLLKEAGKTVAVFSDYWRVKERMEAIGLGCEAQDGTVDFMTSGEELGGLKPAREAFLAVANMASCLPAEVVVFGDREDTDGAGASSAGMGFVKV